MHYSYLLLFVLFACPCVALAKPGDLCGESRFFFFYDQNRAKVIQNSAKPGPNTFQF